MTIPVTATDARMPAAPLQAQVPGYMPSVGFGVQPGLNFPYGMQYGAPADPGVPYGVSPFGLPTTPHAYGLPPVGTISPFGTPLGGQPVGVPPAPIPQYGMPLGGWPAPIAPIAPIAPLGIHPFGAPFGTQFGGMPVGMPPLGVAPLGIQPMHMAGVVPPLAPIPTPGIWPAPIAPFGIHPFGAQLGMPLGVPPAPVPFGMTPTPFGMPLGGMPLGVPPAPIPGVIPPLSPTAPIAAFLLSQIGLKEAASHVGDEAAKARVIAGANEAIARITDDLAGVTLHPWLKAGALAWTYPIVADLTLLANKFREGAVRTELLNVAGQLLSKGLVGPEGEDLAGASRRNHK